MGAPLSPTLANIFMELLERKYILSNINFNGLQWYRYVEDIFAIFPMNIDPMTILEYINKLVPSIKFTLENPRNSSLPFLDVLVKIEQDGRPLFSVYRKETHTNCYVHWFSQHSISTKRGILKGQFLRAFNICSPASLDKEIDNIRNIFGNLSYPTHFINKILRDTKSSFYGAKEKITSKKIYVSAPLNLSYADSNKLPKDLCVVSSVTSMKEFFTSESMKHNPDNNNSKEKICGIYKIDCKNCKKFYIGESDDIMRRQYQHRYDLRTDNPNSALVKHRNDFDHLLDINGIKVVKQVEHIGKRRLLEALIIKSTDNINVLKDDTGIDTITCNYLRRDRTVRKIFKNNLQTN